MRAEFKSHCLETTVECATCTVVSTRNPGDSYSQAREEVRILRGFRRHVNGLGFIVRLNCSHLPLKETFKVYRKSLYSQRMSAHRCYVIGTFDMSNLIFIADSVIILLKLYRLFRRPDI